MPTVKDLRKVIKDKRCLVFLDLEATQTSHEMIQIGAYKVYLDDNLLIKKCFKPFQTYVKPKHHIGKFVTDLTGITDLKVKREGVSYRVALNSFKKYCGKDFYRCLFVVYGNSDASIFRASMENNMDASKEDTIHIIKHIFDFCFFAFKFVQGEDGNPLSLKRILDVFGVPFDGQAHDALADTKNLMYLYQAMLKSPNIMLREYKKTLVHFVGQNQVITEVIHRLANGKTITPEDFEAILKDTFQ